MRTWRDNGTRTVLAALLLGGAGVLPMPANAAVTVSRTWEANNVGGGDDNIAAGPNYVVTSNNFKGEYNIWTKSGTLVSNGGPASLFPGIQCDQHIIFDEIAQRWITSGIETNNNVTTFFVGISDTSDPTGAWSEVHNGLTLKGSWPDGVPTGYNADAVFVSQAGMTMVITKSSLLDKNSSTLTDSVKNFQTGFCLQTTATSGDPYWTDVTVTGADPGTSSTGEILEKVTNVLGSPTNTFYNIPFGTTKAWNTGQSFRNNKYALAGIVNQGSPNSYIQWAIIDVSSGAPKLQQWGVITPPAGGILHWPTCAQDPAGDILITYQLQIGSNTSIYAVGRCANDPPDTLQNPILVASDTSPITSNDYVEAVCDVGANGHAINGSFWATSTMVDPADGGGWSAQISNLKVSANADAPGPPASLTVAARVGYVKLYWNQGSGGGAAIYSIYRRTSSGGKKGTPIATGIRGTKYQDNSVVGGTKYYYQIKAVNSLGTSGYSREVSATPVANPSGSISHSPGPRPRR